VGVGGGEEEGPEAEEESGRDRGQGSVGKQNTNARQAGGAGGSAVEELGREMGGGEKEEGRGDEGDGLHSGVDSKRGPAVGRGSVNVWMRGEEPGGLGIRAKWTCVWGWRGRTSSGTWRRILEKGLV
jgi:hypothetical protein